MQGREIIHGRFLHPEERKAQASPGLYQGPLKHLEILAGMDADDERWLVHMLSLAEDAPQEEKKERKPGEQSDEALMDDFIFNKGIFAQ